MKTFTEISARDTFIAQSVYLVPNSLLDWKPVEKLKERCYVVSFTFFQYVSSVSFRSLSLSFSHRVGEGRCRMGGGGGGGGGGTITLYPPHTIKNKN